MNCAFRDFVLSIAPACSGVTTPTPTCLSHPSTTTQQAAAKMPIYRNIMVQLHSDTTDGNLPEIPYKEKKHALNLIPDPVILELAPPATARHSPTKCLTPLLQDDEKSQISVYVPIIPKALFWISYRIDPPPVDGSFFVFKLFVNRKHVVTWNCDADNKFKGKTMFGLFDTSTDEEGKQMEKRVFQFGGADSRIVGDLSGETEDNRFLEVQVFRANKKKRIPLVAPTAVPNVGPGMQLANGGYLKPQAPQRYYRFGLIDPKDSPHVTFRFYYRTWEEIDKLDLRMGQVDLQGESLFVDSVESLETATLDPMEQAISSSNRASSTTTSSLRNSGSNASISGDYFNSYPRPYPQGVVYAAQPYPPGASFSNQRAMPPHPTPMPQYHASPMPMFYAPQPVIPPPANPYSWQPNSVYNGTLYSAPTQYPFLQGPHQAAPTYQPTQSPSNFSMPFKRLSIPPQLLLQPLLSKGPLPPGPTKMAQQEIDAQKTAGVRGSFAERERAARMALEGKRNEKVIENVGPAKAPETPETEMGTETRGRSPGKQLKRKSEEKVSSGGSFRLFGRLRSKERDNVKSQE